MGFKTDVPTRSPLAERAAADFSDGACCAAGPRHGCCQRCFTLWLRTRLMEHWRGDTFWQELDRADFGLLKQPIHPNHRLAADVVVLVMTGSENLTILTWALETGRPLDQVVEILTVLDVNARRLPRFRSLLPSLRSAAG
jgi:hypothetical protein